MMKIPRNRADAEMFTGWKESPSFENRSEEDSAADARPPAKKIPAKAGQTEGPAAFVTPELQEAIGRALLELKLQLYKEGLVDYTLKVSREGRQVILSPAPVKTKNGPRP